MDAFAKAPPPRSANRWRAAVNVAVTGGAKKNAHAQLPQLLQVVELLRQQQAAERQFRHPETSLDTARSQRRAIYQPLQQRYGRFHKDGKDEQAFLVKLSPIDFRQIQNDKLRGYCEIRNWFFESPQYERWRNGRAWHLCCSGSPRCGKTTFAAAVARDLRARSNTTSSVVVLFLNEQDRGYTVKTIPGVGTVEAAMRVILRQMVEDELDQSLSSFLLRDLAASSTGTVDMMETKVLDYIAKAADNFNEVYLVIDGLDCLAAPEQSALKTELLRLNTLSHIRLMLVHAPLEPVEQKWVRCDRQCEGSMVLYWHCEHCADGDFHLCDACYEQGHRCHDRSHAMREPYDLIEVQLRTPPEELISYVQQRFRDDIHKSPILQRQLSQAEDVIRHIEHTIATQAAGVFVLAKIYIDYLLEKQNINQTLDILAELPEKEIDYFDSLMHDVQAQAEPDRTIGLAALALAATAWDEARPLSFEELKAAENTLLGSLADVDLTPHRLLYITKGFLVIETTPAQTQVKPFHAEVGTYLRDYCQEPLAEVGLDMVQLCLSNIISANVFFDDVADQSAAVLQRLNDKPFVRYSLQNWPLHYKRSGNQDAYQQAAHEFLNSLEQYAGLRAATLLSFAHLESAQWWPGPTALHYCSWFGLADLINDLLSAPRARSVKVPDPSTGRTALHVAVMRQEEDTVKLLLDAGADASHVSENGWTALWEALEIADASIFEQLVDRCTLEALKAINNASYDQTILHLAAQMDDLHATQLLLNQRGVDISAKDVHGRTVLHVAAEAGHASLLGYVASHPECARLCNTRDLLGGRTPLMLMLECESWNGPVHTADSVAKGGEDTESDPRLAILQLLLKAGADPHVSDDMGRNLLHYAVWSESRLSILAHLHSIGLNINARTKNDLTPLHLAVASPNGTLSVVKTLVSMGADVGAVDRDGRTAYDMALAYGVEDMAEAVKIPNASLVQAASVPLWAQIMFNADDILNQFERKLRAMSDDEIRQSDPLGFTLLHCAIEAGSLRITQLLLDDKRVEINARNIYGQTALSMALAYLERKESAIDLVKALIRAISDPTTADCVDYKGHTTVGLALNTIHQSLATDLVNLGAQVSQLDHWQKRALVLTAIETNDVSALRKLIEVRANVFVYHRNDMLPSQLAKEGHASAEVVAVLEGAETTMLHALARPVASLLHTARVVQC